MWNWLPDRTYELLRDVLTLVLAGVGVWLALVGARLAKLQTKMAAKADRLADIQLGREAQLEISQFFDYRDGLLRTDHATLSLRNTGVTDLEGFKWLLATSDEPSRIVCRGGDGGVVGPTGPFLPGSSDVFESGYRFSGAYDVTVPPYGSVSFATIELADEAETADLTFDWWIGTKHKPFKSSEGDRERITLRRVKTPVDNSRLAP